MRVGLLNPEADPEAVASGAEPDPPLLQDLGLDLLLDAMGGSDPAIRAAARRVLLAAPHAGLETVRYRLPLVEDALRNPGVVGTLYEVACLGAGTHTRGAAGFRDPDRLERLRHALAILQDQLGVLARIREVADREAHRFRASGWRAFFALVQREFSAEYLASARAELTALAGQTGEIGSTASAGLGTGNRGTELVLRRPSPPAGFLARLGLPAGRARGITIRLDEGDEEGARALRALRAGALAPTAAAAEVAAEEIGAWFLTLRDELGFHCGAVNLYHRLSGLGARIAMPQPQPPGAGRFHGTGLYDVALALRLGRPPVANAFDAGGRGLILVTGANQGGKSSFLRAIGQAQLMMQAGMFVGAATFEAELCRGLQTHAAREEDPMLRHGRLDDELRRFSDIVDRLRPGALLLLNESFAATTERDGSQLALQAVTALREHGVRVVFVTHLYGFARTMTSGRARDTLCLRAERRPDGTRTYRLRPGEPTATSHGQDVYREVFPEGA
ncbi:MAG: DNA mismatch repair protein MutS [Gemmatimonadales bacterium]